MRSPPSSNVNYYHPPQVTLSLRRASVFGDTTVFCGPARFLPLSPSNPISEKLVHRIDAARLRLPTLYPLAFYAKAGGLISYGFDTVNQFQRVAEYVDRILHGAKPADLPVQYPTKFQLVVNLKTAKTLGLTIPESFLQRADEVIE